MIIAPPMASKLYKAYIFQLWFGAFRSTTNRCEIIVLNYININIVLLTFLADHVVLKLFDFKDLATLNIYILILSILAFFFFTKAEK
jgi:hypothetical protein